MASIITKFFQASSFSNSAKELLQEKNYSKVGDLYIDAIIDETINLKNTITKVPIETGSSITDHVFKEQVEVKMVGYITDTPIKFFGIFETPLQKNSLSSMLDTARSLVDFTNTKTPTRQAYFLLEKMRNEAIPISVITELKSFKNMMIANIEVPKTPDTRGLLKFTIDLVQVQFASVANTSLNSNELNRSLNGKTQFGIQTKDDTDPTDAAANEEFLFQKEINWINNKLKPYF
jgi:hypothetical protein